jgi:hypothetical protein
MISKNFYFFKLRLLPEISKSKNSSELKIIVEN